MSFNKFFEHCWHFILVSQSVADDDPGSQALEGGELKGVDLAIWDDLQQVDGSL